MRSTWGKKSFRLFRLRVAAWHLDSHELQHTQDSGRVYLHCRLPSAWVSLCIFGYTRPSVSHVVFEALKIQIPSRYLRLLSPFTLTFASR
jgi:hypothetical protein